MCGFLGSLSRSRPIDLKRGLTKITHRGPDFSQIIDIPNQPNHITLAHNRLSIIDLSDSAHQPFIDKNLNLYLVYNGEIYNYQELRKELESFGYKFRTDSDTEVLLFGYHKYKEQILTRLRGMFAFAIYDTVNGELFLARDRVGKKPLYYYFDQDKFVFASEIKAILAVENVNQQLNTKALSDYFSYNYIPSPHTIYQNIAILEPGQMLNFKGWQFKTKNYWKINYLNKNNLPLNEIIQNITQILDDSVRLRMLASDVPVGAFLSGGIDSSAVVALASKYTNKLKTFSIKFSTQSFDESKYARIVADIYKTDHYEFLIEPDLINILPQIAWQYDQPYADSSALPTYYLAQKTSEHVKVALTGDGGDESFIGYDRYVASALGEMYDSIPKPFRKLLEYSLLSLPNSDPKTFLFKLKRLIKYFSIEDNLTRHLSVMQCFDHKHKSLLMPQHFPNECSYLRNRFREVEANNQVEKIVGLDFMTYLPEDLLVKVDRASMAHSLEVRAPFLDHHLIEYLAKLPLSQKFKRLKQKYLLKYFILKDILPHHVMFRSKMGFGVPIHEWFRKELSGYLIDKLLNGQIIKEFDLNKKFIESLIKEHQSKKSNYSDKLWNLLMLELWWENQDGTKY